MEYHSDRFTDASFIIYRNNEPLALFPGNKDGQCIYSHQGLTYGGFILSPIVTTSDIEPMVSIFLNYLKGIDISEVYIKSFPGFYHSTISLELETFIKSLPSECFRTDKVLAIDYSKPLKIHKTKLKHFRKNQSVDFKIEEANDCEVFWNNVLIPRLKEKYDVKPVHSLDEISLLKMQFPQHIKQYNISLNDTILAGITIFDKGNIVKSQYGATTEDGEQLRALEYLFLTLIYKYEKMGKAFFSMGTVRDTTKPNGYNEGLLKQKQELGCELYSQNFYKVITGG